MMSEAATHLSEHDEMETGGHQPGLEHQMGLAPMPIMEARLAGAPGVEPSKGLAIVE